MGAAMTDGVYCAAMDARRSHVYTALFERRQGRWIRLLPDSALSLEELGATLKTIESAKFLVGDGALLCYNTLGLSDGGLILLPEHLRMQRASGVALVAWEQIQAGELPAAGDVNPNYLRLSQAERERLNQRKME